MTLDQLKEALALSTKLLTRPTEHLKAGRLALAEKELVFGRRLFEGILEAGRQVIDGHELLLPDGEHDEGLQLLIEEARTLLAVD